MQRGSVFMYILVAIALLGVLTMSFVEPGGQQSRSQNAFKLANTLKAQAETYRAAIQDCVLTYPQGDTSGPDPLYAGYNKPYPVTPDSTYLPVGLRAPTINASYIRCPGNPGDSNNHSLIFDAAQGRFAPPPIPQLDYGWVYVNDSYGAYLVIGKLAKGDAYLADAFQKVATIMGSCEAEYIPAPTCGGPGTETICLRVWITRNLACP